jgi:circadian clock protein KaiC
MAEPESVPQPEQIPGTSTSGTEQAGARPRISTGVPGLDTVLGGGLPEGALLMIGGPPGAGKTVLAEQIAFHQAARGRHALILTTLSEPNEKLIRHIEGFSWFDRGRLGREIEYLSLHEVVERDGMTAARETISRWARRHRGGLVVLDAIRGLGELVDDPLAFRKFLFGLGGQLGILGATGLVTGEYDRAESGRQVEYTIVDGIVSLQLRLEGRRHLRSLEVVKLRGTDFLNGVHTMRIDADGVSVYPRHTAIARVTDYAMGDGRAPTGIGGLDAMLSGGLIEHSLTLMAGTPGVGKTLLGLQFLADGARRGEPGLIATLDESPAHLEQKARRIGLDRGGAPFFDGALLDAIWEPAVEVDPDLLAARIRAAVAARPLRRVVLDAFSNLEPVLGPGGRADYVVALTNFLRGHGVTSLLIRDAVELAGSTVSVGGLTFAATADNILVLRHVEIDNRLARVISVVKTRDSDFDPAVRRYSIADDGLGIGEPLQGVEGTMMGLARLRTIPDADPREPAS